MTSRITLRPGRFAQRPNGVVQDNVPLAPFSARRFFSTTQLTTLAAPTYATPSVRVQQDVTFFTDSMAVPGNDTFIGMETFATSTVVGPSEDRTHQAFQHPPDAAPR